MSRFLVMTLAACTLVIASCRGNQNNVILSSLNRSAKLQFLCADVELLGGNQFDLRQLLPSVVCTEDTTFAPEVEAQFLGAVTQAQTGEVAVVSFTGNFIFNTSRTIPGVTAFTVQEQPTGIQISPFEPSYTYVTSFSAKSVQAIPTEALLTGSADSPTPDPQRFDGGPTDLAMHEAALTVPTKNEAGEVTGAASAVLYRYLYAAIPELGQVAQVEVLNVNGEQTLGEPVMLPLGTIACPVTMVDPPASDATDYNRMCPEGFQDREARVIKTVTTTTPCVEGGVTGPRPVALAIDHGVEHGDGSATGSGNAADDILLVADANQPVIHRFALGPGGATPLDPIITGTPTSEIDVTPLIPKSSDPDDVAATERYLYAVSALDSSVLVVDYTDEGAADSSFGAVLPVIAGISARANEENIESRNRARFEFANARAIEVVSPDYTLVDAEGSGKQVEPGTICDPNDSNAFALAQSANNMRGVFLAVSLSNGTMYFLDIYDLNAPCRGGEGNLACTLAENGPDRFASIRRHRRRFDFTSATFIEIDGTPSFQFNTAPGRLDESNGDSIGSDGPGLDFIECPLSTDVDEAGGNVSSMIPVFGRLPAEDENDGLICASSQVWSSFSQRWDARWEGLIPHSEGGLGLFADSNIEGTEEGSWFQGGDVPFCRVGVLGPQESNADLVPSYGGDRLIITGELPPSTRDEPDCEEFKDLLDDIEDRQVWFPILRAFNDELEIGEDENGPYTLDEVRNCFPQFTEYQIHSNDAYTVTGTETGFVHRVIPNDNSECVLDPDRPVDPPNEDGAADVDTYLGGRAFPGQQFINPLVSFKIRDFPETATITDSTVALLNFNIINRFRNLVLPTGVSIRSLPSSMLFSPQQGQLFFVDFEAGVRRIIFSPLSFAQSFE